uniref:Uncharacterized protein n=1 Tax=Trypanosoma vivax (strain Y486) TaxID=1055687 RepID=G0U157_TRYVY|nr:hypothetical protein TVY486_0804200 [Trypanosoma vivax Y486]
MLLYVCDCNIMRIFVGDVAPPPPEAIICHVLWEAGELICHCAIRTVLKALWQYIFFLFFPFFLILCCYHCFNRCLWPKAGFTVEDWTCARHPKGFVFVLLFPVVLLFCRTRLGGAFLVRWHHSVDV